MSPFTAEEKKAFIHEGSAMEPASANVAPERMVSRSSTVRFLYFIFETALSSSGNIFITFSSRRSFPSPMRIPIASETILLHSEKVLLKYSELCAPKAASHRIFPFRRMVTVCIFRLLSSSRAVRNSEIYALLIPSLSGETRGSGDETGAFGSEGFCGANSSIGSVADLSSISLPISEIVLFNVPSPIFTSVLI